MPDNEPQANPSTMIASIHTGPTPTLPAEFSDAVLELEKILEMPVVLLVQGAGAKFAELDHTLVQAFLSRLDDLPEKGRVGLLVDSPGGQAKHAYQIATILRKRCGGFTAIVPRYAKSAATLLVLGADAILLGTHAELGPLDAQIEDPEREEYFSALDEVQALERLHAFAMEALDRTMFHLLGRTKKKVDTLLPLSLHFIAEIVHPLFEDVDAVRYTQMSRALKVAEEYASRLLLVRYPPEKAQGIARHLVEKYPEHPFIIDLDEAARIEPDLVTGVSAPQQVILDKMLPHIARLTAIGRLQEAPRDEN